MKTILTLLVLFCFGLCCATGMADPDNPRVVMETTYGDFVIELFHNDAPITVDNFLHYTTTDFYNDTLIHRIVKKSQGGIGIIQGGGYYAVGYSLHEKTPDRPSIVNESYNRLSNLRGTIAMARTNEPNSATSQFFINQTDNTYLDKANNPDGFGYCVFGKVVYGMQAIDIIAEVDTYNIGGGLTNFPIPPVAVYAAYEATYNFWFKSDFNYDGIVDEQDLGIVAENWLSPAQLGDLETNGIVDFSEFAKFSQNWQQTSDSYRIFAGDINNDKKVNFADFSLFANTWNQPSTLRLYGDLNLDAAVDYADLDLFAEDWLKQAN